MMLVTAILTPFALDDPGAGPAAVGEVPGSGRRRGHTERARGADAL